MWAAFIFVGSTDVLSQQRTSRFLVPLLHWIDPDLSDESIQIVRVVIRKGGHLAEYGVLALLTLAALNGTFQPRPPVWSWRRAGVAVALCFAYAASDELHQATVPSRMGSPADVAIDTVGAATALGLLWASGKLASRVELGPPKHDF